MRTSFGRWPRGVAGVAIGVLTVSLFASPAFAFHGYSRGFDFGPGSGGNVTAISQRRADQAVTSIECVYQTQWDQKSDASLWIEEGTEAGSECDYPDIPTWHWYWGYGVGPNFYTLGTRAVGPGPYHTFDFYRYAGYYYYYIDSTLLGSIASSFAGDQAVVGLESYDSYTTVNLYQGVELKRTVNGGAWQSWVAADEAPSVDPGMCGYYVGATTWRAAEPPPC